jgi:hypothetical protein
MPIDPQCIQDAELCNHPKTEYNKQHHLSPGQMHTNTLYTSVNNTNGNHSVYRILCLSLIVVCSVVLGYSGPSNNCNSHASCHNS